jgi:general secretion pathway protein B
MSPSLPGRTEADRNVSYLLESLKRLEEKRQGVFSSDLLVPQTGSKGRPRRKFVWLYVLSAALFANAGVAVWWLVPRQNPPTTDANLSRPAADEKRDIPAGITVAPLPGSRPNQDSPTRNNVRTDVSATTSSGSKGAAKILKIPVKVTSGEGKRGAMANPAETGSQRPVQVVEAPPSVAPSKPGTSPPEGETAVGGHPDSGKGALPELKLSLHSYSPNASSRLVRINDRTVKEGDILFPGTKVEEITPDGVIINHEGQRLRLSVDQDR